MLAIVKTPHIEIRGAEFSEDFLAILRGYFKAPVEIVDDDEETEPWVGSDLEREISARSTPGSFLNAYRHRDEISQVALAKLLGVSRQAVCDMEKDRRPISGKTARLLADIFRTRLEVWLK